MNPLEQFLEDAGTVEAKLCYAFKDKKLLSLAFTHRSFINEYRDVTSEHNERLEFLGDAILGMLVSDYLFTRYPNCSEGDLSLMRSRLVAAGSCATYTAALNLADHLLLGKGERMNDGRGRESILANLFEAIIGAIYLDGGIDAAKDFLFWNFLEAIEAILDEPQLNPKAELQDYVQKNFQETPIYEVVGEEGPDHSKSFRVAVLIRGDVAGVGIGLSKKEAQQAAATDALKRLIP